MAFNWLSALTGDRAFNPDLRQLKSRLLNDPYYRLQSLEEVRFAASLGIKIDVNQAGTDDWLRLPGISIHQARTLTALTQSGVQFYCLEDIAAALNLPLARLQPFASILHFCYYDPATDLTIQRVNANTATVEMLIKIPGVDLYLARAIAQNRALQPYKNLSDFQQRLQLPAKLVSELMHYLYV